MTEHQTQNDLAGQIKKIADHLVFLEKKLDTLLEEVQNRGNKEGAAASFPPRREFSRPFRPGGKPPFRPQGDRPYNARPSYGAKPQGDRPYSARPYGNKPQGDRPYGAGKPQGARNFHRGASAPGAGARHPQTKTWRPNKEK